MRKLYILITLLSALLSGCVDGEDGDAYLAFYWTTTPTFYSDNNSSLPLTIYLLEQYLVSPGTYSFTYTVGSTYAGTYTITEEEGDPGLLPLIPGADGEDSHFELGLYSSGPSFYEYSAELEQAVVQSNGTTSFKKDVYTEPALDNASEETVITQTKGGYTFTVRYIKL